MRALYRIVHRDDAVVAIEDAGDHTSHLTVTNNAEDVVLEINENEGLPPERRLVYRDSEGRWDELLHDGAGNFCGFNFLDADSLEEALELTREAA